MTIWDKCSSCERCDEDPYRSSGNTGLRCLIESSFWDDNKICPYWKSDGKEVNK